MLYNSDDNENQSKDGKLFGADDKDIFDDAPAAEANENSVFGTPQKDNSKHESLFDSSYDEDDIKSNDTVASSFVVSFKNNDPVNSVSDKLKQDNVEAIEYEDDLADFDFDSSISAFKPLAKPIENEEPEVKKTEEVKPEPKAEIKEETKEESAPNPFKSASAAKDIDFAASESTKSTSSFSGNAPANEPAPFKPVEEVKNNVEEVKEEVKKEDLFVDVSDEKEKAQAQAPAPSSVSSFAEPEKELSPDKKAFESFKSSTKPMASKPAPKEKLDGVQTYGKVASGVDAFGKSTNAASVEQRPPVKRQANNVRPGASTSDNGQIKRPPRRGTSNAPSAFASNNGEKRIPPSQRYSAASQTGNIQPVQQVETRKKKSSFGVGSIIAVIVLFVVVLGAIVALTFSSKISKYFKGNPKETTLHTEIIKESKEDPTEETETSEATSETTTEATTTEATTTEATTTEATTTEATTEATTTEATTTEATTTEATTTATTTEATTTEATTTATTTEATTTEKTTETTTKPSSGSSAVTTFYTSMSNFSANDSGFTCNLVLENYGSKDAQLKDSVNSVKITFNSDKTITSVTSDYFTFTADPNNKNTFIGTPSSATIESGEKFKAEIKVSTDGKPSHYGYKSCYYDWNK